MAAYESKNTLLFRLIGQICCCKKIDELKTAVLEGIRRIIPYESAAFFLVNPDLQYKEPLFRDLDSSWFDRYSDYYEGMDIYKKTVFTGGIPPVDRSSDYLDYSEWGRNEHRADFLLPQGIYHLACLQVIDGSALVGEISLHRGKNQQDFSDGEMDALLLLHQHINSAYARIRLIHQRDELLDLVKTVHLRENSGLILFDGNFRVVNYNRAAAALFSPSGSGDGFIDHLRGELKGRGREAVFPPGGTARAGLCRGSYRRLSYRSTAVSDSGGELFYLVLVEDVSCRDGGVPDELDGYRITRREREIAGLILQGKTNADIRGQLFISENTLKTHIKQLYSKLNVKNRSGMVFKLLRENPPGLGGRVQF